MYFGEIRVWFGKVWLGYLKLGCVRLQEVRLGFSPSGDKTGEGKT